MQFTKEQIVESLKKSLGDDYVRENVERFANYCVRLLVEKKRDKILKNPWMQKQSVENLDQYFRRVHNEGLIFDGEDVTLTQQGINYNYQAWKRKMMLTYPETIIDLQLMYEGDDFSFKKESGKVIYSHVLKSPFNHQDDDIIGGYIVIKNRRGEFLNTLSRAEIDKRRKVAKTDAIWKAWFKEMCLKTLARNGFSFHFKDEFQGMIKDDNELHDLDQVEKPKVEILQAQIIDALEVYQGEDKDEIRTLCNEKHKAKEFTEEFAQSILQQLGA